MIPHIVKGGDMRGLVGYLVATESPKDVRANQHEQPRVVGGEAFLATVYGGAELTGADVQGIADYLDAPRRALQVEVRARAYEQNAETGARQVSTLPGDGGDRWRDQHVWHCSLSLADGETLTAERWGQVTSEFADGMGLTETSGHAAARWVAIHHGEGKGGHDHVHIAASAVREDGTRVAFFRDYPKAQQVCRELERKHGLVQVLGREHSTARRGATPAELGHQQREDLPAIAREELAHRVRATAVAAGSEAEWVRQVRANGMVIKPRFASGTTDVTVGYRVALKPPEQTDPIRFYSGTALGADLSLPRLREVWADPSLQEATEASAEWQAAFAGRPPGVGRPVRVDPQEALQGAQQFADRVAGPIVGNRALASLVAHDVAGTLAAWARFDPERATELTAAAAVLARTSQDRRPGRAPGPQRAGTGGAAAVFLMAAADKPAISAAALMAQLIRTAEAIAGCHRAVANHRDADRVSRDVVARLRALNWSGYGQQPLVPDRARGVGTTVPRPTYSRSPTTREDGRDAGR